MEGMSADSLESAIKGRYEQIGAMYKSQDFVEGPKAFAESGAGLEGCLKHFGELGTAPRLIDENIRPVTLINRPRMGRLNAACPIIIQEHSKSAHDSGSKENAQSNSGE